MSSHRIARARVVAKLVVTVTVVALMGTASWAGSSAAAADIPYASLVSFEVQSHAAVPDEPVTISYEASSETPLRSASFNFAQDGRTFSARTGSTTAALTGAVQLVLPDGARDGTWQLTSITLVTTSSAETRYLRSGAVTRGPLTPSQPHDFDLPASDVVLSGSTEDLAYPGVTSLSTSTGTFTPGQDVTVDYVVQDQTALARIFVVLTEPRTGRSLSAYRQQSTGLPSSGSIVVSLDASVANGTYTVTSVNVVDIIGNEATYQSDGTVTTPSGDRVLGHHDLPFSTTGFTVTGSTADYDPPELTAFTVEDRTVVSGQPLTVSYAFSEQKATLASLTAVWQIDGEGQIQLTGTDLPASGRLSGPTPAEGVARLEFIAVSDGANSAVYHRDGTLVNGRYPNPRHAVDFATRDVTVGAVPGAPAVTVVPGNASATVQWQSAAAHASAVTAYKVTVNPGGQSQTLAGTGRSATFTGLANGTAYTFSVVATNAFGAGGAGAAKGTPRPFVHLSGIGDWDGDFNNDLAAIDSTGALWAYKGNGRGGFLPRVRIGTGWQATRVLTPTNGPIIPLRSYSSPDLTSVRHDGTMVKYIGTSRGRWQLTVPMPGSWSPYSRVIGVGEWTEDDQPDLLTVDDSGVLRLHRASGYYSYAAPSVIGTGWGTMRQVFAAGDFSGDLHADLMGVAADGGLYLYKGNGKGGWLGSRVKLGTGWQGFSTVLSPGDFTGDDRADIIGVKPSGDMYLYKGNGRGGFTGGGVKIGSGWAAFL